MPRTKQAKLTAERHAELSAWCEKHRLPIGKVIDMALAAFVHNTKEGKVYVSKDNGGYIEVWDAGNMTHPPILMEWGHFETDEVYAVVEGTDAEQLADIIGIDLQEGEVREFKLVATEV